MISFSLVFTARLLFHNEFPYSVSKFMRSQSKLAKERFRTLTCVVRLALFGRSGSKGFDPSEIRCLQLGVIIYK